MNIHFFCRQRTSISAHFSVGSTTLRMKSCIKKALRAAYYIRVADKIN